jgi:hypothetical protein
LPHGAKKPVLDGWQDLRASTGDLADLFPVGRKGNVGLLLGEASGGLVDIDLDSPQAVAAAALLLPATGWICGHKSKPKSHYFYVVSDPPAKASAKFKDVDGSLLLEIRSTGGQTMVPPSLHPSGEVVSWDSFTEPAAVTLRDLRPAVSEAAAAALLARHWPAKGSRHELALALAGGLLRCGWNTQRVYRFLSAVYAAAGTGDVATKLDAIDDTAAKLKAGQSITGWPTVGQLLGDSGNEVVRRVREWLAIDTAPAESAPVPEPPPWPAPPGDEAFAGLAGDVVRVIEPASEADPSALLVQTMVAFGNMIGRTAYFSVEADRHHGNESAVLVGRTSKARKGTSWGHVYRLFREVEEQWAADRVQTGASSGEGIIWSVRDPISKRERIKEKNEVHYEEVEADPGVEDKRLLVFEPEYANVLKQLERQGNTLSVILRQAWDGNDLRALTKNSPARASEAHVSLIGHVTIEELRRYLTATETANGFGNRHLWVCTDRSKLLPDGGCVDEAAWAGLRKELAASLQFARTAGEVQRDDEARALWHQVYGSLSEGKPGLAGALLARAEAHVTRLALLYALLDRSRAIKAAHLLSAVALWDYAERSVYHIFGDDTGDPVADELLKLLRSSPNGLSRSELRDYFGRNQSSDRIGRALGLLLQHKRVWCQRQDTGGRPAERWFAVTRDRTASTDGFSR